MSKKHSKPSDTPGASLIQEPAQGPAAAPVAAEPQAQPAETEPSQDPPAAPPREVGPEEMLFHGATLAEVQARFPDWVELPGLPDNAQPTAEELAQLPGGNPPGSVSGLMRNGETLTVPFEVAEDISDWLDTTPGRSIDSGRVYDDKVVVVSHPDGQKKTFPL